MTGSTSNAFCVYLVLAMALMACGGPEPGHELGPCYGNGTCNDDLVCLSDICVDPGTPLDAPMGDASTSDASASDASASDAAGADAAPPGCALEVTFTPTANLQIVVWLEHATDGFVDTMFITEATGRYGLGNRPGIMEFNSAYLWPHGRRTTLFPVWAHRHGISHPRVGFQNDDESNLSHPLGQSSTEEYYCRPLREGEAQWDTMTCSSIIYTDKGKLAQVATSLYPPRSDLVETVGVDDPSVADFAMHNQFDSVSSATPPGDLPYSFMWPIPPGTPDSDYRVFIEVGREFDQNAFYDYPSPVGIPWSDYGLAYRGQPSVLYAVDIAISTLIGSWSVLDYHGYGDPDGLDGNIRVPDGTITTGVDGSGASRLLLVDDGMTQYRVRVALQCP